MSNDLAALIGSRICHDLISPIGAIGNGVELLSLTAQETAGSPEFALINESVENANARIRFFRIAFGAASANHTIGSAEVRSVLTAMQQGGRLTYDWQASTDQSRADVRIVFLLLQCIETALPLGGDVAIQMVDTSWHITATGRRIDIDEDLWNGLAAPDATVSHTAAQVQFALLPHALRAAGKPLDMQHTDDSLSLRF